MDKRSTEIDLLYEKSWQLDFGPRTIYEMPKSISNKENSTKCGEKPQTLANKPAELEKRDEVDTTKPKLDGSEASFTPTQPPDVLDNPVFMVEKAVNKKLRNLVKREQKLRQLKKDAENGVELNAEQMDSLTKLGELENQIEFIKELQALTEKQLKNYQKAVRRRDYQFHHTESVAPSVVGSSDDGRNSSANEGEEKQADLRVE